MLRSLLVVAALTVVGRTSLLGQEYTPNPVSTVYRLSYPIMNREGDTLNYMGISQIDGMRTYWANVPNGATLSPTIVNPPNGTFSRSRAVVQHGWKHSIDVWTGTVAASVPMVAAPLPMAAAAGPQTVVAGKIPLTSPGLTPNPVTTVYRLSRPIVNREGETLNYVGIAQLDGKRTYWANVPKGATLNQEIVDPPMGTFSRAQPVVQNGWKHSIDIWTGTVAASVPTTATPPEPQTFAPAQ